MTTRAGCLAVTLGLFGSACASARPPGHWPEWRGPDRDNVSKETGLLGTWPEGGPPLEWEVHGIGKGTSGVAVRDERVFVLGSIGAFEYVTALEEATGMRLWRTALDQTAEYSRKCGGSTATPRPFDTVEGVLERGQSSRHRWFTRAAPL